MHVLQKLYVMHDFCINDMLVLFLIVRYCQLIDVGA